MTKGTPSIQTMKYDEPSAVCAALVPPPSPPVQTSVSGQGEGVGSAPGVWGSPAETGLDNALQSSTKPSKTVRASFLNLDSPCIEVTELGGHAPARTAYSTTLTDPALAFYRTLADAQDFPRLEAFCAERLLLAGNDAADLRWRKDSAIARALQGHYLEAHEILNAAHLSSLRVNADGLLGRYQNERGIVLARLGRTSLALDRFNLAYQHAWAGADLHTCASVDTARARALVTRGETLKALRYLRRAERVATEFRDYRLLVDICETRAAAYGELSNGNLR